LYQGYYFAKPMPLEDFEAFLRKAPPWTQSGST